MHKKTIALFCVFLTLLVTFAACKKHSPYGVILVDEKGMEHVIMTDANGVTVIDDDGNLVEVMTDSSNKKPITTAAESGKAGADKQDAYETHAVTFPGVIENGQTAENAFCIVTLPDNWDQIGNNMLILREKETDARIMIYTDVGGTVNGALEQMDSDLAVLEGEEAYSRSDVTLDGLAATRTQYELGNMTLTSYLLITEKGKIMRINTTVETAKRDAANVDAVVQLIHFK